MAMYGSYSYESTESRALKSIKADGYNKDQAKNLIQLNHNSEYMAQYLRKLQKGVDEANQNTIEQIQSMLSDILVLFAGGSNTQLEFGDLKYIFHMFGALFGITDAEGNIKVPPNLFDAAWNFFSTYIVPLGDFEDVINIIIDNALAFILDIFGEVPVVGEAAQQIAVWITDLRDTLMVAYQAIETFLGVFSLDIGSISDIAGFFTKFFGIFRLGNLNLPDFSIFNWAVDFITNVLLPTDLFPGMDVIQNIFSSLQNIRPEWLPQVSLFSIGDSQPNCITESDFRNNVVISGGGYTWDGTDGRSSGGCARVDCDGDDHVVYSNFIPVSPGQKLDAGAYTKYQGVNGTATIRVNLVWYNGYDIDGNPAQISTENVGSITPSPDSADWSAFIQAEKTVPENVDGVAMQLRVTEDGTTGIVKFDDCWIKKKQLLKIPFIDNLPSELESLLNRAKGIVDKIVNAFENFGELIDIDLPESKVLDAIFGIFDVGLSARTKAAALESRIKQLESAANTITLDFIGSSTGNPGTGWTVSSSGGGAGNMGLDGKGNLVWKPSGAGNRTQIGRYDVQQLGTNNGRIEWILCSSPQSYIFDDAYTYINFRMKDASNYTRIRSGYGEIRMQAVVGGSAINIGPSWSGNPKAGDEFVLDFGDAADANQRKFTLYRNGNPIIPTFTESGTASLIGTEYRKIGAGMETGNRLVFSQNIPAGLGVLVASERL